jgi:uncharacterized RDD family membrane protein YckC
MKDDSKTEYIYAGFWWRFLSALIDGLILQAALLPILVAVYGTSYIVRIIGGVPVLGFWDFVINYIFPAIIIILFWNYKQATPGKMIFKIKIVNAKTGEPPELKQWVIRYMGYFLSTIALGLGFLWIMRSEKKQGWHDYLAETVVIRSSKKSKPKIVNFSENHAQSRETGS